MRRAASSTRVSGCDPERGSLTLFFLVAVLGLLVLAGLVVDGGAKVAAVQRADHLAAEAARTGGQMINVSGAIEGSQPRVDAGSAAAAALSYLRAQSATGTVTAIDGGRALQVQVQLSAPTTFLAMIGIGRFTVTGTADVDLVRGVTGANQ